MRRDTDTSASALFALQAKLRVLFLSGLKIGAIGFGGFVALVATAERELARRQKLVTAQDFAEAIAVAALLPGSFAVNTIAIIGYLFAGFWGAQAVWVALVAPSVLLVIGLAAAYQQFHHILFVERFLDGLIPAVVVIITSMVWELGRKNLRNASDASLMVVVLVILFYRPGLVAILVCMLGAAIWGVMLESRSARTLARVAEVEERNFRFSRDGHKFFPLFVRCLFCLCVVGVAVWLLAVWTNQPVLMELFTCFGFLSLSLFGGGYVAVPMMGELVVAQQHWLSAEAFAHAIAIGQSTPGPIMISATFIGYVVAGIAGALVATLAIFLPPVLVSVLAAAFAQRLQNNRWGAAALSGLKPAVIALLIYALYAVGITLSADWISLVLVLLIFALATWRQLPQPLLIVASAALSMMLRSYS